MNVQQSQKLRDVDTCKTQVHGIRLEVDTEQQKEATKEALTPASDDFLEMKLRPIGT